MNNEEFPPNAIATIVLKPVIRVEIPIRINVENLVNEGVQAICSTETGNDYKCTYPNCPCIESQPQQTHTYREHAKALVIAFLNTLNTVATSLLPK